MGGGSGWFVAWVRAIGMLFDKSRSLAYRWNGRSTEWVEQIVFGKNDLPPDSLGIDIFMRLKCLVEFCGSGRRKGALGDGGFWNGGERF